MGDETPFFAPEGDSDQAACQIFDLLESALLQLRTCIPAKIGEVKGGHWSGGLTPGSSVVLGEGTGTRHPSVKCAPRPRSLPQCAKWLVYLKCPTDSKFA